MTHLTDADDFDLTNLSAGVEDSDAEDTDTPEGDASGADETTYDIGGVTYSAQQLNELIGKGQDYTRKTQDLAEQRKELASDLALASNLKEWAANDPRKFLEYAQSLVGQQGIQDEGESQDEFEYASDGERILHQRLKAREREIDELKQAVANLSVGVSAGSTVEQIKAKYGMTVSARDVQEAMRAFPGIKDPMKAFAAHRTEDIVVAAQKLAIAKVKAKPFTPGSESNTFNPEDPNMTADDMFRALQGGAVVKTG